jgi:hypothetical protein
VVAVAAVAAAVVAAAAGDAVSGTCQSGLGRCLGQGQRDVAAMARMACEAAIQALIRSALASKKMRLSCHRWERGMEATIRRSRWLCC